MELQSHCGLLKEKGGGGVTWLAGGMQHLPHTYVPTYVTTLYSPPTAHWTPPILNHLPLTWLSAGLLTLHHGCKPVSVAPLALVYERLTGLAVRVVVKHGDGSTAFAGIHRELAKACSQRPEREKGGMDGRWEESKRAEAAPAMLLGLLRLELIADTIQGAKHSRISLAG